MGTTDTYVVELNHDEGKTLRWLSGRYDSAMILDHHGDYVDDVNGDYGYAMVITLDRAAALKYWGELAIENGNPAQTVPTCAGGSLAAKLQALYDEITGD